VSALLVVHLVVGLGLVVAGRRAGRGAALVGALPSVVTLLWLAPRAGTALGGDPVTESFDWVPQLGLTLDLRLDGFAALFVLLVSGIGVLVFLYAGPYLGAGGAGQGRLVGLLVLFSGSMLGLVLADDLIVLFGFWELTSITSFLLIGNGHTSVKARAAALQALLITGAGGLCLLAGFVLIGQAVDGGGTFRLSEVLAHPPGGTPVTVGLVLVLVGAFTKSAQYPFHSWLPGAMVAPTPVSAYLHSATMVKAGLYLIGRFAPAFTDVWVWRPMVVAVGATTMVLAGLRAVRQHDLKLILAYGTVSQLGFMVVMFGLGTAATVVDACELLIAHALFKAALFLVVGIIDHQAGTRDIRQLRRPGRGWGPVVAVTVLSTGSMAGFPLLFGFVAKEDAFAGLEPGSFAHAGLVLAPIVVASTLTVAYSLRFAWGALGFAHAPAATPAGAVPAGVAPAPPDVRSAGPAAGPPPPRPSFVAPAVVLAALTLAFGVAPALVEGIVEGAAESLEPAVGDVHLVVWHGWNLPLLLSAVVLVGGYLLFRGRRRVDRVLALGARVPSGGAAYLGAMRALNVVADRTTAVAQTGSLPVYAGVILTTASLLTTGALVLGDGWPGWPAVFGPIGHVAVCTALVVSAVAAGAVHRRFSAALLLGATGYAMAGLFVVQGGADLALTQVAIETLTTVLFVLVLRRLPDRFESRATTPVRAVRVVAALGVAVMVFVMALTAAGNRTADPVSDEMVERSVPDGGGRNVVNVILVDFRGLDTMSEITVLAAAAIGSVALARAGRRPRAATPPPGTTSPAGPPGLPGPGEGPANPLTRAAGARRPGSAGLKRLVIVDVAVRLVFSAVIVGSIYLLFAGHNQPGGGFVGGIVAGSGVALRYVAGGIGDVRNLSRAQPWTVLGSGLLLSAVTVAVPVVLGGAPLESAKFEADLPLLGHVAVSSALPFDIGVYLVVLGLVLMVFESFGDDPQTVSAPVEASTVAPVTRDSVVPPTAEVPAR
jgi:multicomponent Na+:H+ antiporter subunit A